MKINKYPDGSSYVTSWLGDGFTIKVNSYEELWYLNQFVDAYVSRTGVRPTISIPNLIDAQADRRFAKDQSSGLKLVCKFLNGMNANFKIFHPHNPEVVEALMDNVEIIDNSEFIIKVLSNLSTTDNLISLRSNNKDYATYPRFHDECINLYNNLILMSSDAGGFKPLMKLCDKIKWKGEVVSASKYRSYIDGESKLTQILPSFDLDKDILIIDDICVYGGTFKGLSKAIKSIGHKGNLYLAVSHMTVQNLGKDSVTNYFDKVFTTNSKFNNYYDGFDITGEVLKPTTNLKIIKIF